MKNIEKKITRLDVYREEENTYGETINAFYKGRLEIIPKFDKNGFKEYRALLNGKQFRLSQQECKRLIDFNDEKSVKIWKRNDFGKPILKGLKPKYHSTYIKHENELLTIIRENEKPIIMGDYDDIDKGYLLQNLFNNV